MDNVTMCSYTKYGQQIDSWYYAQAHVPEKHTFATQINKYKRYKVWYAAVRQWTLGLYESA